MSGSDSFSAWTMKDALSWNTVSTIKEEKRMAKYIGKRIVPKHCGEWDRTKAYEMECIVYMPDFMELMAKGIRKSSHVLIASVRELASSMNGAFTGLSLPEIGAGQFALAGAGSGDSVVNNNRSIGSVQVVVNGYNAKNDNDLADTVVQRINEMLNEDDKVWGR